MAGLTKDKDLNDLIEESIAEGFTIQGCGSGHLLWTPPNYPEAAFTSATSPGSKRTLEHVKLQKRRALAGYSDRLSPEKKAIALGRLAQMNTERKDAQNTLKANPFKKLLAPNVRIVRPDRAEEKSRLGPTGKEMITMWDAAARAKALIENTRKTPQEAAENIALAFDVMSPRGTKTGTKSILNILNRKKKSPTIEVPQVDQYSELMTHIRSTVRLPIDKQIRIQIISDLLEKNLL